MTDLPIPYAEQPVREQRAIDTLRGTDAPSVGELFGFMREAETRFESLRLRLLDRTFTARGEQLATVELWLRHPGRARIVTRRGEGPVSRDFDVWLSDGETVQTYNASSRTTTRRPPMATVVGGTDPALPGFARTYSPRTKLPRESIVEMVVHPHGFCRNVLATGPVSIQGATELAGDRECLLLRADHPRTSHLLTDRPDRWLEVGVDRMTGLILLYVEHIRDLVTRHVEVVDVELDPPIPDEAFTIHVPEGTASIY